MATANSPLDVTIRNHWEATIAADRDPDKTIPTGAHAVQTALPGSLAEELCRVGYVFGDELGRGGLGVVNLATQRVFDRPVAVKRLLRGGADRETALKFFAEALITAQLEHPHIVPIHDLMADGDGQLRLVMKRVEGQSWRDLLHPRNDEQRQRAQAMSLDDHLDILLKVCDAMSFAHGRGILHRDLKPENVMVGAYGEVLVMDWGCAVAFGDLAHHAVVPRAEAIDHIAGTPGYLAPEMVLAQAALIGPHSDVYLLGAMLYEVLTHQRPHRGNTIFEVLNDAAHGTIVPPTAADPGAHIPEELSEICLAALAKDPGARIAQVAILAQRLRDYRRHAQAVALESSARQHLAVAAEKPSDADESLRKAVSAAEQARDIWPGWPAAEQTLLDATLAWAGHHLAAGAPSLAATRAEQAAALALALQRDDLVQTARALAAKATSVAATQVARQRQLRLSRVGLATAGVALIIGLAVFLIVVSAQKQATADALAQSQQSLAALIAEQAARDADQKTSAPALVAQARKDIAIKQWPASIAALKIAIAFNPKLIEAHQLHVNALAAAKQYGDAVAAGAHWLELAPDDPTATQLIAACRIMNAQPTPVVATETQVALADLFGRQQLYTMAETTAITPAKRLEFYRKRLDAAWPGMGNAFTIRADGRLVANPQAAGATGFKGRSDIVDLAPLRGMPFAGLDLEGTGVRTLDTLAGMPLEELLIGKTAITDLSPLRGMPLRALNLIETGVADLSPLAGMPLQSLWAYGTRISDITPLRNLPLNDLHLGGCQVADLTPLTGAPLKRILVGNDVRDLAALRGVPLEYVTVTGHGDWDLSPLSQAPLVYIEFATTGTLDLSVLPTSITIIHLIGTALRRPEDLGRFKPVELSLSGYDQQRTIDLAQVDAARLERLDLSHCSGLVWKNSSAPRLARISINQCSALDLSPFAASPVSELIVNGNDPQVWRSLAAFRASTTLTTIVHRGVRRSAAEFWNIYRPESEH